MRIIGKFTLQSGQPGTVQLIVDNTEELWDLYNIIEKGDNIRLATSRKVQHDTGSKVSSFKKTITITLKIEDVQFSPNSINIKGKNMSENEFIKIGQYQTEDIEVNTKFTLTKDYWDDIHLETLKKLTDVRVMSEIVAILMEAGVSNLFYITSNQTISKGKITQSVPKKKGGFSKHDVKENKFFNKILNQFIKQINFENTKVLIIAGPGLIKEDFKKYLAKQIETNPKEWDELKNNTNKIIYTESSSGFKHSLFEILSKPNIKALIKDTKCVDDVSVLEKFNEIKGLQPDKLFFGLKSFDIAYNNYAIDTLIITDGYIRTLSASVRKDLSEKIKDLKLNKIKVCQFSSLHFTGETIDEFGGICGILKYVVEEISELGNEEKNDEKDEKKEKNMEKGNDNSNKLKNDDLKNNKKEDKKEDKKEEKGKNKKKNGKENNKNKNISQQGMANKRKKNAYEDEDYDEEGDYDEDEDYYNEEYEDEEYDDDEQYYYKKK